MIKAIDTCVLARWLMRDDPVQTPIADAIMDGPIEITLTVMLELGWMMTSIGRMEREQFARVALGILSIDQAVIEQREQLRWAVERYRNGADWADMVHVAAAKAGSSFVSFDKHLARKAGAASPMHIEALGG